MNSETDKDKTKDSAAATAPSLTSPVLVEDEESAVSNGSATEDSAVDDQDDEREYHDIDDPPNHVPAAPHSISDPPLGSSRVRVATNEESAVISGEADATPEEAAPSVTTHTGNVIVDDEDEREYHDIDDDSPSTDRNAADDGEEVDAELQDGIVEVGSQDTDLPVAFLVQPSQPPPELLERLRQLESRQSPILPTAIPRDFEEEKRERKAAQRKIWLKFCFASSWLVSIAVVGIVVGVTMGSSSKADSATGEPAGSPTPSPTSHTFAELKSLVVSVSLDGGALLDDESSSQYNALAWLERNVQLEDYPDWKRIQRYVLAVFYYSTNGDSWVANDDWLSDEDECTWLTLTELGPVCDEDGKYNQVTLLDNNLDGSLPLELALLSDSLKRIYLDTNSIRGTIPTEMGLLTNIGYFSLRVNQLSGTIPIELSLFTGTAEFGFLDRGPFIGGPVIGLQWNQLSGSIPPEIFKTNGLSYLGLYENMLSGSIPSEIGFATKLIYVTLGGKGELSGTLPTELGKLSLLEYFAFVDAPGALSGSVPSEIGFCTDLVYIDLWDNAITGSIPSELGLLEALEQLWIYGNMITGPFPSEIGKLSLLEIVIARDNFSRDLSRRSSGTLKLH